MSDAKYFQTTKKGEIKELQDDLNSVNKIKIKEAVKQIIAAMTVGKDVSVLFTDVIKSMNTDDIELKKLIYLYIMQYARAQPEKAILVVSMFCKDSTTHPNPLIRALALRTMGCIRVHRIAEYLCDPLYSALKDKDPYVRKTAAICVAKFYDLDTELVRSRGFIDSLRDLLSDPNPMVVANAVASLTDICESSGIDYFKMDRITLSKLLTALNECTEWGRVFILEALSKFEPKAHQAQDICDRVMPQLAHANAAVVMAAVKVIIKFIQRLPRKEDEAKYCRKLAPSLVSLLSSPPEVQYVALRNMDLIVQKYPKIFEKDIRVFYVKYNDEPYVKNAKLRILVKLATPKNVSLILKELEQYAQQVDVDFVKRAVRGIGHIAIGLESAADACVECIAQLIQTNVSYIVEECVIVIKDIFRRYRGKYEKIIVTLCDHLQDLNDSKAKASMVWIIGEYAERIVDARDRLEPFIDSFDDENGPVQLQLLTATVKLFLKKPTESKALVQRVLHLATESSDNPDLRDRAYVYWRLLSTDPTAARKVVLAERPLISVQNTHFPKPYLSSLLENISSLSSVYHCTPNEFVIEDKHVSFIPCDEEDSSSSSEYESSSDSSSDEEDIDKPNEEKEDRQSYNGTPLMSVLNDDGVHMKIGFQREQGVAMMIVQCANTGSDIITRIDMKFNKNYFGIQPTSTLPLKGAMKGGDTQIVDVALKLSTDWMVRKHPLNTTVQMAARFIRTNDRKASKPAKVALFNAEVPAQIFVDNTDVFMVRSNDLFISEWKSIPVTDQETQIFGKDKALDVVTMKRILEKYFVFINERKVKNRGMTLYFSGCVQNVSILLELSVANTGKCRVVTKSRGSKYYASIVSGVVVSLIQKQ
eukprot:146107_1